MTASAAIRRFRVALGLFVMGLLLSGLTAFPLLREMRWLVARAGLGEAVSPAGHTGWEFWLLTVRFGLEEVHAHYPWEPYGTDWLAFGHIVIAFFFIDPLRRPAASRPVLYAGIAACLAVFPLAFICGALRGIPVWWRLVDCSFGAIGLVPLLYWLWLLPWIEAASPARPGARPAAGGSPVA